MYGRRSAVDTDKDNRYERAFKKEEIENRRGQGKGDKGTLGYDLTRHSTATWYSIVFSLSLECRETPII
jgi:hypothetical protein